MSDKDVELNYDAGGESSLVPDNLAVQSMNELSSELATTIMQMAKALKGTRRLSTLDKSQVLGRLVKAYSDLVRTHRALNGLDVASASITAGVIIIPGKAENWVDAAKQELDSAKKLIADVEG